MIVVLSLFPASIRMYVIICLLFYDTPSLLYVLFYFAPLVLYVG